VDASHSTAEFAVKHLMIATVKGRFGELEGTVELDPERAESGRVDVTIKAASVDTRSEQRDAHLRSPDFFDVEKHPTITYRSRRVEPLAGGQLKVVGDLTIRGISREVPLAVTPGGFARDPWGNERAAYVASAAINRGDFGLTWNAALETGGVLVGDEVKINLEVELVRQAAQAAA
jgi:polyisoprenoid-binding protein YceI